MDQNLTEGSPMARIYKNWNRCRSLALWRSERSCDLFCNCWEIEKNSLKFQVIVKNPLGEEWDKIIFLKQKSRVQIRSGKKIFFHCIKNLSSLCHPRNSVSSTCTQNNCICGYFQRKTCFSSAGTAIEFFKSFQKRH